jgi:Na+/H+-dicarboxylate symporter
VCLGVALLAVPFAVIGGRMGLGRFLRAAAPVQVVAISTQSSLACLPAMIEGMRGAGVSARVAGLVLPLAVSLLRVTSPAGNMAVALYVARLNGVDLSFADIAAGAAVAGVISFGLVSLPSATTFLTALVPIALTMGVPVEMLPLLVAIETLPDISRTIGNVMGDMAATAFLGRDREEGAR